MSDFYAALAQTVATFLGILAAVVVAYSVFHLEREAKHQDEIDESVIAIRDHLLGLKRETAWTLGAEMFLPEGFRDTFRAKHPNTTELEAVVQGSMELAIDDLNLAATLAEAASASKFFSGHRSAHWRGPVYVWLLRGTIYGLSGGPVSAATQPERFFPFTVDGTGFQEWRDDFARAQSAFASLLFDPEHFAKEYFTYQQDLKVPSPVPAEFVVARVRTVASTVATISTLLGRIDKQETLKQRYPKVRYGWVLVLLGLGLLNGVVAPLWLMTWHRSSSALGGSALLLAALIPTAASLGVFSIDLFYPRVSPRNAYILQRWEPRLRAMAQESASVVLDAGVVDLGTIVDAQFGRHGGVFPPTLRAALDRYASRGMEYNAAARVHAKFVRSLVLADQVFDPTVSHESLPPSVTSTLAILYDEAEFANVFRSFREAPRPFGISFQNGPTVELLGAVSERSIRADPTSLEAALRRIRVKCQGSKEAAEFLTSRAAFLDAQRSLLGSLDGLRQ